LTNGKLIFNEKSISPLSLKDHFNKALEFDCKNLLPEKYLMKADKSTMANSLEERLPLIDREVVDFMFTVPSRYKMKNGNEKILLKKAMKDILPNEIIKRKKIGFNVPYVQWIQKEQKDLFESEISSSPIIKKFIPVKELEKLFRPTSYKNTMPLYETIWNLFTLVSWCRVFKPII
jgi:asparagine synthase (glutamine-hydrolysing)